MEAMTNNSADNMGRIAHYEYLPLQTMIAMHQVHEHSNVTQTRNGAGFSKFHLDQVIYSLYHTTCKIGCVAYSVFRGLTTSQKEFYLGGGEQCQNQYEKRYTTLRKNNSFE